MNNGTLTKDIITEFVINMGDIFEVLIIIEQTEKLYIVYLDSFLDYTKNKNIYIYIRVRGKKKVKMDIYIYSERYR